MRVVFMGTPDFAVPTLAAIAARSDLAEVVAVVTQPDRPRGRGKKLSPSPVKAWALAHDIPVMQPVRARDADFVAQLRAIAPDLAVVVAFGQILSQEVLDVPVHGCINVHASLLPKLRGAAPIQHAIMAGERVTGITTMQMDAGLDTGDMLLRREVPIHADTTYGSLHDALMETGASLLVETLEQLAAGTLVRTPQTGESSYAARITRETAVIDWSKSARALDALVRGLNPLKSRHADVPDAKEQDCREYGHKRKHPDEKPFFRTRRECDGLFLARRLAVHRQCLRAHDETLAPTVSAQPFKKAFAAIIFFPGA